MFRQAFFNGLASGTSAAVAAEIIGVITGSTRHTSEGLVVGGVAAALAGLAGAAGGARDDQVIVLLGASVGLLFVAPMLSTTLEA